MPNAAVAVKASIGLRAPTADFARPVFGFQVNFENIFPPFFPR
jgi:hypothetical protein